MDESLKLILLAAIPTVGLKVIEGLFNTKNKNVDDSAQMRKESRDKELKCEEEKDTLRKERDNWQERYYNLLVDRSLRRDRPEEK